MGKRKKEKFSLHEIKIVEKIIHMCTLISCFFN